MASSTNDLPMLSPGQAGKELAINSVMSAASPAMLFGRDELSCIGLTMRIFGGAYAGEQLSAQSITLSASATNYVEADASTGVVTSNAYSFTSGSLRLYTVQTSAASQTSWTDHRQVIGLSGSGSGSSGGLQTDTINTYTKAQGVSPVAVPGADGAVTLNLGDSNGFRLTLAGAMTLGFSNPRDGFVYTVQLKQDGTGGRAITWPASIRWPGGVAPTLSAAPGAIDLLSLVYDAGDAKFNGVLSKAFA